MRPLPASSTVSMSLVSTSLVSMSLVFTSLVPRHLVPTSIVWIRVVGLLASPALGVSSASAASLAPPMFDISRQCEVASGKNVTAMSECIVAESIARADLFQKWDKLADTDVRVCLKANQKAKRRPYSVLAKCLSVADVGATRAPPVADPVPKK